MSKICQVNCLKMLKILSLLSEVHRLRALDNVFELLVHSGKLAPLIKLMMIPDAWSKRSKTVPKNHQDFLIF